MRILIIPQVHPQVKLFNLVPDILLFGDTTEGDVADYDNWVLLLDSLMELIHPGGFPWVLSVEIFEQAHPGDAFVPTSTRVAEDVKLSKQWPDEKLLVIISDGLSADEMNNLSRAED